jgi:hypothetical protein
VLTESTAFQIGTKAPPFKVSLLYWQHSNTQKYLAFLKVISTLLPRQRGLLSRSSSADH